MNRKYKVPTPSEVIVLIGENFIVEHLFHNFKRFSKMKIYSIDSINKIEKNVNYIIDCSFNEKSQNDVLKYSVENKIKKVIILSNYTRCIW